MQRAKSGDKPLPSVQDEILLRNCLLRSLKVNRQHQMKYTVAAFKLALNSLTSRRLSRLRCSRLSMPVANQALT